MTQVSAVPQPSGDRHLVAVDSDRPLRVFLLDDHELVRRGLADFIHEEPGFEVAGQAASVREALDKIPAAKPDVAVLDVRLPDGSGIEVCREIRSRYPDIHCLILTSYEDDEALFAAIMAGAAGYILKLTGGDELIHAIRSIADGRSHLDSVVTNRVLERLRKGRGEEDERLARLTEQEHRVLEHIARGLTNKEIAQEMYLSEKTVRNYVSSILAKLGMKRRTEAAVFAIEHRKKPTT